MRQQAIAGGLHISTLAQRVGMTPDTLRYYERLGLLSRPARAENGYRVYSTTDVGRLLFIRRGKLLGLSLEQIRALVQLAERGECQPVRQKVAELLRQELTECEARLGELLAFKAALEERYELAAQCEDEPGSVCATFPTDCDCLPVAFNEVNVIARAPSDRLARSESPKPRF